MAQKVTSFLAHGELNALILQAVVRKLIEKGRTLAGRRKGLTIRGGDTRGSCGQRTDTTSSPHHGHGGFGARIPGKLINGFGLPGQRCSSIFAATKPNLSP